MDISKKSLSLSIWIIFLLIVGCSDSGGSTSAPPTATDPVTVEESKTGTPQSAESTNLQRWVLTPMLKEAGLPHLTWHHLRHNAGSYLLSENVPITAVSKILGHANPAITMSIYAHELVEDLEQVRVAMAKFA